MTGYSDRVQLSAKGDKDREILLDSIEVTATLTGDSCNIEEAKEAVTEEIELRILKKQEKRL